MGIVRYILVTLVLAIAGLVATVLLLAATPAGFAWLAERADKVVPGELAIDAPGGSLITTMRAAEIRYVRDELRITATGAGVRLNWVALVAGEVRLSRLHVDRLTIAVESSVAGDSGDELPEVGTPVALRVVRGAVDELVLNLPNYSDTYTGLQLRAALRRAPGAPGEERGL